MTKYKPINKRVYGNKKIREYMTGQKNKAVYYWTMYFMISRFYKNDKLLITIGQKEYFIEYDRINKLFIQSKDLSSLKKTKHKDCIIDLIDDLVMPQKIVHNRIIYQAIESENGLNEDYINYIVIIKGKKIRLAFLKPFEEFIESKQLNKIRRLKDGARLIRTITKHNMPVVEPEPIPEPVKKIIPDELNEKIKVFPVRKRTPPVPRTHYAKRGRRMRRTTKACNNTKSAVL